MWTTKVLFNGLKTVYFNLRVNMLILNICEKFNQNKFALYYVNTKNQEADIFTKAMPRVKFEKLRKMIGVVKLET